MKIGTTLMIGFQMVLLLAQEALVFSPEVVRRLNKNNFLGTVYFVYHRRDPSLVCAMKVLSADARLDEFKLQRSIQDCPNVCFFALLESVHVIEIFSGIFPPLDCPMH